MTRPVRPRRPSVVMLVGVGVVLVLAGAVWAYINVPGLYPPPAVSADRAVDATDRATRSQAIVTTRASVLAALAGLGALVTIAINYRNSQTTNRTFRITERGHLTDRYTKAIEQLGDEDSLAIRLGGIYALQQFAIETDRVEDHVTVVEVLSAFIRASLPRLTDRPAPVSLAAFPSAPSGYAVGEPVGPGIEPELDVLAAISALAQLPVRDQASMRADFTGVDFTSIRLSPSRLTRATLTNVFLAHVDLSGVDLSGADLSGANLHSTELSGADLRRAFLVGADLSCTDLRSALLTDAVLGVADLRDSRLSAGQLSGQQRADALHVPAATNEQDAAG